MRRQLAALGAIALVVAGGNGSACLDAHVDDYIVNAAPSASGTAC